MSEASSLNEEDANELVLEHKGWAESIARSVARAWNLDWQLDGLDGAAMEALIFCSRRFKPDLGVPFKGYARKRIHEASCEAARKSKGWHKAGSSSKAQQNAREISMDLLDIFPELRSGTLPGMDGDGGDRNGIRQLLVGASLLTARYSEEGGLLDDIVDHKRMIGYLAHMEVIHQVILWKIYWEGQSMRSVASDWETDELNVIREHKALVGYLHKSISRGKPANPIRVRPGLKNISVIVKRDESPGPFSRILGERRT